MTKGNLSNYGGGGNEKATKKRFHEKKKQQQQQQSLCMCVINFGTFLCRPLQSNKVNLSSTILYFGSTFRLSRTTINISLNL